MVAVSQGTVRVCVIPQSGRFGSFGACYWQWPPALQASGVVQIPPAQQSWPAPPHTWHVVAGRPVKVHT
jgi:hypothetical protein